MRKFALMMIAACATVVAAAPVFAWDGDVTGKISSLDVSSYPDGYDFRVQLVGSPVICGTKAWGYVSKTDGNYETYVSVLLSSFLAGRSVNIFTDLDTAGMCKIGYVIMRSD